MLTSQTSQVILIGMAHHYSIYEAKAKFSELLRRVKGGTEVTVTERGRPVAKVIPLQQEQTLAQRLKELEHCNNLIPRRRKKMERGGENIPGGLERFLKERE